MEYNSPYQSASTKCAITGKKIDTMEPHLRIFGDDNIPVKIDKELPVFEEMKNKLKEPHKKNTPILQAHKTSIPCQNCGTQSDENIMLYDVGDFLTPICLECLNEIASKLEEKINKYHDKCIYYDSAGISIHNYPQELPLNNVLKLDTKYSTFIRIGRNDVGDTVSHFPIKNIEKINQIIQTGRKSRYVRKVNKNCNCDTCTNKDGEGYYRFGRNPENMWNVITLCEGCLDNIRNSFSEIIEMDEVTALLI